MHHGPDDDLSAALRQLVGLESNGPFVAHAETLLVEGEPHRMVGAPRSLLHILDDMGLDRQFSSCMGYHDASQCRPHFEAQEEAWRGPDNNFSSFTGVKRPRSDRDVAIAVGGNIDADNNLTNAAGATQYQGYPAIDMAKDDPDVIRATKALLKDDLAATELTQALALIDKKKVTMDNGKSAFRYQSPVGSSLYIPQARRTSRVSDARGFVVAKTKRSADKIYVADVYA
jgi:hypothetical protein